MGYVLIFLYFLSTRMPVCLALMSAMDWLLILTFMVLLELNIHDDIERGDNDSIKVGDKDVKIHKACSS